MLVKCDGTGGCGKEFRITGFNLDKMSNDIEKTYFKCPYCNKEYIAFYTDKSIRKKQKKIRKLTDLKSIEKLKQEIGKDMDNLKARLST